MADSKEVYKVVRPEGKKYVSAWTLEPGWKCEYGVGQRTVPHMSESFLFAFSSLEGATAFAYDNYTQVWLATGEGVKRAPFWLPTEGVSDLNRYWHRGHTRGLARFERIPLLRIAIIPFYINGQIQNSSEDAVLCKAITLQAQVA